MTQVTVSQFRRRLSKEVGKCAVEHDILRVTMPSGDDFVVLNAQDWQAIEETLYLNQIPGMVESIHAANKEPLEKGTPLEKLKW
ncbi:MAG: type II toxin-antitoxin system Phd/YefM family antitoxin [Candidatus Sumerlaeota bacterium]|nr:type II toxin-antitoxin system Phd/YefM family antitoxin [Candidatus Sumerlaeota bacterium]